VVTPPADDEDATLQILPRLPKKELYGFLCFFSDHAVEIQMGLDREVSTTEFSEQSGVHPFGEALNVLCGIGHIERPCAVSEIGQCGQDLHLFGGVRDRWRWGGSLQYRRIFSLERGDP